MAKAEARFRTEAHGTQIVVSTVIHIPSDAVVMVVDDDEEWRLHLAAKPGVDAPRVRAALEELGKALGLERE